MAAAVTYQGGVQRSEPDHDGLFEGRKLWFSQAVPQRTWLMQNAQLNGAQIVQLEQQADIKLVDHTRKNQAPGTYSYRFVELSIRNGHLEDLESHRVGSISRVNRPVGSIVTAPKSGRNKFTEAEDQLLWNWITPYKDAGGYWRGNEIYKQLEQFNSSHTFQSWRDRYIRLVQYQDRKVTEHVNVSLTATQHQTDENQRTPKRRKTINSHNTEPQRANISALQDRKDGGTEQPSRTETMVNAQSPQVELISKASDVQIQQPTSHEYNAQDKLLNQQEQTQDQVTNNEVAVITSISESERRRPEEPNDDQSSVTADNSRLPLAFDFTQHEARLLYRATCRILDAHPDTLDESWAGVIGDYGHTKEAWLTYFHEIIVPEYKRRNNIHSDAELEAHCRAHQLAEHERKVKKNLQAPEFEIEKTAEATEVQRSAQLNEGENLEINYSTTRMGDQLDGAQESSQNVEVVLSNSIPNQSSINPEPSSLSSTTVMHRPPQPNESRKLSQGRGSQSTSSQSRSQSQPFFVSQSSQTSPRSLAARLRPSLGSRPPQRRRRRRSSSGSSLLQHVEEQVLTVGPQTSATLTTSQQSKDQSDYSNRFVTQASQGKPSTPTESSADLQDIPFRAPTPLRTEQRSESPLFVTEEIDQHRQQSSRASNDGEISDLASSLPEVQLVDDEDVPSEAGRVSDYAPSETPSEGVQFESEVGLSQGWETAPETMRIGDHLQEGHAGTHANEPVSEQHIDPSGKLNNEEGMNPEDDQSSDNDFETAFMMQRTTQVHEVNDSMQEHTVTAESDKNKLDTQALFQQPTQNNLAEIFALPEPSEGWDEDAVASQTNAGPSTGSIDWTLPLPDPEAILNETRPSPSVEGDDADIDNWLAAQLELYRSISPLLLQPLSHRALESTSMDLEEANTVLARMVQRYEKGKYPAHLSLANISKLRKKERKSIISTIVDELVPEDMPGCWTRMDDMALQGVNGREVKRLEDKHGNERITIRFEFLELWNKK